MKIKGNTAVRVALIQMACSADPEQNFESAVKKLNEAADAGAQIVCLPELFRSQYFCQIEDHKYFALAEEIPGPSTDLLAVLAAARKITIVASLFERRAPGLYHNTAVVINARGELLGRYRKMHIPDDPLYYEKFYFTPGDTGFRSWKTEAAKIGVCICWDQWYPEAARLTALSGAQIIFYPTAIGWHPGEKEKYGKTQFDAWETIQRSHAIANGCFIVAPNRVGHEAPEGGPGIEFWGQSFFCAPSGQILKKADSSTETVLLCDLDLALMEEQRTHWPFLRDRRIDAYGDLTKRYIDSD